MPYITLQDNHSTIHAQYLMIGLQPKHGCQAALSLHELGGPFASSASQEHCIMNTIGMLPALAELCWHETFHFFRAACQLKRQRG